MDEILNQNFENGVLTVKLPKDIDHHSAKVLRGEIDKRLLSLRPGKLILDLTGTQFMDSSGLGLILGRARVTQELKMEYLIVNPNAATQRILAMAGVEKLVKIQTL